MSNLIVNGEKYEIVQKKETANFEVHGFVGNLEYIPDNKRFFKSAMQLHVRRNFVDDTFSMYFPEIETKYKPWAEHFSLSSNNTVTVSCGKGIYPHTLPSGHRINEARSFVLDNLKFTNTSSWTISYNNQGNEMGLSAFAYFSTFEQHAEIKENQALEISLIHNMYFAPASDADPESGTYHDGIYEYPYYSNFFIVPRKIDQYTHQVDIADIYKYDEDEGDGGDITVNGDDYKHTYDFSLKTKYNSSAFSGNMDTSLSDEFAPVTGVSLDDGNNTNASKNIYKIGTVHLDDQSFYDYDRQKTEVGLSNTSGRGEILPLNFKGSYTRSFELGLVDFLKHFKVSVSKNIPQQVLDPYSGLVKLEITDSSSLEYEGVQNILDGTKLQELRKAIGEQKFIPLEGLRRFSNE